MNGITNSLLIFADVTSIGAMAGMAVRNGNVMYEIGIAHAVRLPEEVILFRSDHDPLLFDLANIRVNSYDADGAPQEARGKVQEAIIAAIKEIDLSKHLAVKKAVESFDNTCWHLLAEARANDGVPHPQMRTMKQVLGNAARERAISRLLEMGAIMTSYLKMTPEWYEKYKDSPNALLLKYQCTEFGKAILAESAERMGLFSLEMQTIREQLSKAGAGNIFPDQASGNQQKNE